MAFPLNELSVALFVAAPLTATGMLALALLTRKWTAPLKSGVRRTLQTTAHVVAGACVAVIGPAYLLWLWSWRYMESPGGTPPWIDAVVDFGIATTGVCFALATLLGGATLALRRRVRKVNSGMSSPAARG